MSQTIILPPVYVPTPVAESIQGIWDSIPKTRYNMALTIKECEKSKTPEGKAAVAWIANNDYLYGCAVFHGLEGSADREDLKNKDHLPPYQSYLKVVKTKKTKPAPSTSSTPQGGEVASVSGNQSTPAVRGSNVPSFQKGPNVTQLQGWEAPDGEGDGGEVEYEEMGTGYEYGDGGTDQDF